MDALLVEVCGLPGAGKSTLSTALADRLPALALRVDAIEAAMLRHGVARAQSGIAAYSVMHAVAVPHLLRGQTVIADAVSGVAAARQGWVSTAEAAGAVLRVVEVVCPDVAEHRRRVEGRENDLPGFTLPTWDEVERTRAAYEPRTDHRLVVDGTQPLDETVQQVLAFLRPEH